MAEASAYRQTVVGARPAKQPQQGAAAEICECLQALFRQEEGGHPAVGIGYSMNTSFASSAFEAV
ncbi:hypothetical protein SNOG_20036 [Parastagonospora nodorum SN15]|uniref:Uncharacterized protein n=1 Tax=Phaeosphaeria nodorum (strain SN15 / ATCC MYA-4574 / FGSC 10173) TaxID=321614 RepID=A9JX34_PHANO|nr:hypothetical protein SNOG_20036 [Parastagonospora nodorum SN15]EDP89892.1 hypothetical protein SNOG_20036 [Parastagonospora nodorum SN15]